MLFTLRLWRIIQNKKSGGKFEDTRSKCLKRIPVMTDLEYLSKSNCGIIHGDLSELKLL